MVVLALALVTLGAIWVGARIDAAFALQRRAPEGLSVVARAGATSPGVASLVATERDSAPGVRPIMDPGDLSGSVIRPGARLRLPEASTR